MFRIITALTLLILTGCEAVAIKNVADIQTKTSLNKNITAPFEAPVAYYVDKSKPENNAVNFYGKLEEAAELVTRDYFPNTEKLSSTSDFQYLFLLKSISKWDQIWGNWQSELSMEVVNRDGLSLYKNSLSQKSKGAGLYDFNAVHNALASSTKELLVNFLNQQGQTKLAQAAQNHHRGKTPIAKLKTILKSPSPSSTGTGFFINNKGIIATASHVVDECLFIEVNHKGDSKAGDVRYTSPLLDLAVITTNFDDTQHPAISQQKTQTKLGKQVFVTGFPLADILSDYPSLTIGNISSIGGLKGSKGHFQFSAPVQPGNSGGAIVDYKGNLVGVVSSSLNQEMLLKEAGTTAQNLNFGIDLFLLKKFLDKHKISYPTTEGTSNFESASADAVEYTNQVLCYN